MNAKILIIDDEEGVRYTFKKFLSCYHHEVSTAENFDEAMRYIASIDFDVIFADIILKGKSGLEVLRMVKEKNINCPVIMMTGYPSDDTAAESDRLGAFDYIQKPISKDTIFSAINLAIQHKTMVDEKKKFQK